MLLFVKQKKGLLRYCARIIPLYSTVLAMCFFEPRNEPKITFAPQILLCCHVISHMRRRYSALSAIYGLLSQFSVSIVNRLTMVSDDLIWSNISNLFTRSKQIHSYPTRSAIAGNFHVEMSRTNQRLLSFSRTGTKIWNGIPPKIRQLKKSHFKRKLNELLLKFLKIEEMNVDMRYINLSKYMAFL